MITKNHGVAPDIESDPFGESIATSKRNGLQLLGGRFDFESNSARLLRLVDAAYAGLPAHRFSSRPPEFRVRLEVTPGASVQPAGKRRSRMQPAAISMIHGAGFLGSATESSTFVVLSPAQGTALVSVSRAMLPFEYHVRYELIEFAVFTLASRAQGLVPLHAACVGLDGRAALLMGASGSGKTTVALHCLLNGFDFLSEDSVFIAPKSLQATGTANYIHVRGESLKWLEQRHSALIRRAPTIRRRSGVTKYEVDLRRKQFNLAPAPLEIAAVAFLSPQRADGRPILKPLSSSTAAAKMAAMQGYGASLPQWRAFSRRMQRVAAFEVRRGRHPLETVEALRSFLGG